MTETAENNLLAAVALDNDSDGNPQTATLENNKLTVLRAAVVSKNSDWDTENEALGNLLATV